MKKQKQKRVVVKLITRILSIQRLSGADAEN